MISEHLHRLRSIARDGFVAAPMHVKGFAHFLLRESRFELGTPDYQPPGGYGGVPELAEAGFWAAQGFQAAADGFVAMFERFRQRPADLVREELAADDLATLGIALGIVSSGIRSEELGDWFLERSARARPPDWTARARDLAHELLQPEGRLRAMPTLDLGSGWPLEVVLRNEWPSAFTESPSIPSEVRGAIVDELVLGESPVRGEFDRAVVHLRGLELLVTGLVRDALPSIEATVELLRRTTTSFARWVWEERSQRKGVPPVRWLIDREAHVQAFLWAVLRPVFGSDLIEEEYLASYGLKQPKADFGILSLKLLIEVKYLRTAADLKKTEDEVAADLGSYFQAAERFDRLLVYVYDDQDHAEPEKRDLLRQALKARDKRIVEVIVVQRPGMMPPRSGRDS